MITIRKAVAPDFPAIQFLLGELDIGHPSLVNEDFWAAIVDGEMAGVVNAKDCGGCLYVGAVGVRTALWRRGVAKALLNEILPNLKKPVYLYTKIPDFFRRFGFIETDPPPEIPPREIYGCDRHCNPSICVCMKRPPNELRF